MQIRLQKFLAGNGVASRRKSELLIESGLVTVNGVVVTEMGFRIDPGNDRVCVGGKPVTPAENPEYIYIMLHKPEGCVSAVTDQFGRETVTDILGPEINARLYPVGRLDYNTTGLLLLTNDGDLTYKLTHPKHDVKKIYVAKISGEPTDEELSRFRRGIDIDGLETAPAEIEIIRREEAFSVVKITISEGRNRQVRKMCQAIGHPVMSLKRIATGEMLLGDLKKGSYRHLTDDEVKCLKAMGGTNT